MKVQPLYRRRLAQCHLIHYTKVSYPKSVEAERASEVLFPSWLNDEALYRNLDKLHPGAPSRDS
jgi:hypothetical protein